MTDRASRRATLLATLLVAGTALSCATRPEPYMGSPSRGQMITHFDLAVDARGYAIQGDLDAFKQAVEDLADLAPARDLSAEIILQLGPMRWEARQAVLARTIQDAAAGAAKIAGTCGDCHQANGNPLGDRFTVGGPPPAGTPARHMAGLAWASRLLWDGIIGPSDEMWREGARGLVELGALPEGLTTELPAGDVRVAGARLQQLGERAALLREPQERMEMLGQIWATCASCHAQVR